MGAETHFVLVKIMNIIKLPIILHEELFCYFLYLMLTLFMSYRAVYLWLWFLILCTVLLFSTSFHYPTPLLNPPFLILLDIKTIRMSTHIADILWSVILFSEFLNTSCLEKEIILKYGLFVLYIFFQISIRSTYLLNFRRSPICLMKC